MNGKKRCIQALQFKPTDRVPVHPQIDYSYAAAANSIPVSECFLYPEVHAEALSRILDIHQIDGLYVNLCLSPEVIDGLTEKEGDYYATDISGAIWKIPKNDVGTVCETTIDSFADSRLKTLNPLKYGINETFSLIPEAIKDRYLIVPGVTGAFSQIVFLMGLEKSLIGIIDKPRELIRALEWRTELAINCIDELAQMGAECIWIGEGPASSSIISPQQYERFVLPFQKELVKAMRRKGIYSIIHICGDINNSLHLIAETTTDAIDLDYPVELGKAIDTIGDKVCVKGNINPQELMDFSEKEIYEMCIEKIMVGQKHNGYILSTGCVIARDTPKTNIDALVRASLNTSHLRRSSLFLD